MRAQLSVVLFFLRVISPGLPEVGIAALAGVGWGRSYFAGRQPAPNIRMSNVKRHERRFDMNQF
jgi:hypothetical protein